MLIYIKLGNFASGDFTQLQSGRNDKIGEQEVTFRSGFTWTSQHTSAALAWAEGQTVQQIAKITKVDERTIYRWKGDLEFQAELDRLSSMIELASRAERMRLARRLDRQKIKVDGSIETEKDLLDWLKLAPSETQGLKLDLTAISEAHPRE